MTAPRIAWRDRYRAARISGIPRAFRHAPALRAEADRLRPIAAPGVDVDGNLTRALASLQDWHAANAERAGCTVDRFTAANALNLAANSRRNGGRDMARALIVAARGHREREARL